MALSANLVLRQNQSLVMTPQLVQSIQLLQMTHVELLHFIQQEVERNPLLEIAADDGLLSGDVLAYPEKSSNPTDVEDGHDAPSVTSEMESNWYEKSDGHLNDRLDTNFDADFADEGSEKRADAPELYGQWKSMPGAEGANGDSFDLDDFVAGRESLRDHIERQLAFLVADDRERLTARILLDHLDETGYFQGDLQDIANRLGEDVNHLEATLAKLQTAEPSGIFARSLSECLAIQLRQKDRFDPAMAALIGNLELLAKRDFASLKKICRVDEEDLLDMLAEIRKLNPKPGLGFENIATESVTPDILVRPDGKAGWLIELNPDALPRVLLNQTYIAQVSQRTARRNEDNDFLSECLQSANWLTRSLDQRAKTIMKVATEIIRQQNAFLTHGVGHLRPMNLKTVADAIKMHESTVSRVTTNKFMLTPRGLFELKYFFSVSIASAEGGDDHSAESVRHRIKTMISEEGAESVLSDDDIVACLKSAGIDLARRTVAKYREAMNIPSSVQRRREKRAAAKVPCS